MNNLFNYICVYDLQLYIIIKSPSDPCCFITLQVYRPTEVCLCAFLAE